MRFIILKNLVINTVDSKLSKTVKITLDILSKFL